MSFSKFGLWSAKRKLKGGSFEEQFSATEQKGARRTKLLIEVLLNFHCLILKVHGSKDLRDFHKGIQGAEPETHSGGIAQLGEHLLCKQGVRSSILLISTRPKGQGDRTDCQSRYHMGS